MMSNQDKTIITNDYDPDKLAYDVFLSFRGEDTRYSFTGFLYDALFRKGVRVFMDDEELKGGDRIAQSLVNAIQQSKISIVVFSENYATSRWCLDELVEIVECMELKKRLLVWPIFYKVAPSDVRHQRKSYAEAMAAHEERFGNGSVKVHKWRSALSQVANLKGWSYQTGYEYEFIHEIVKRVTTKLQHEQVNLGEHLIGHQSRIEELRSLLDIESQRTVCMLGIYGTGGIGKTALAKALYNTIIHKFECSIFLEGVRERSNSYMGLVNLQEAIISKLYEGENIKLENVDDGITKLKDTLKHKRVLLVLDDVDSEDQIRNLAGERNWFGSGSRIIITTRDKHVLNIVHYAKGLPLALKVLGSHFANKSIRECECALKQFKRIQQRNIHDILKVSYDCLEDATKCVFLDIACFFKGASLQYVENVLEKCDLFPSYNIGRLVDKSLLAIENDCLIMHDLIQDMGIEIVRQEAPSKLGKRSRLCSYEDVLRVLREDSGSSNIEGIMLDPPKEENVIWSGTAFQKMNNIRILIVRNTHFIPEPSYLPNSLRLLEWDRYPSKSLPSNFHPKDIVDLSLPCSQLNLKMEQSFQKMLHLTYMNLSMCQFITHFPDASGVPNLKELKLNYCQNLIAIHPSVGFLIKLKHLSACHCMNLKHFSPTMWLPSLQYLNLDSTSIEFFPQTEKPMHEPLEITMQNDRIKELPSSISNLMGLRKLYIRFKGLVPGGLPKDLFMLLEMVSFSIFDSPNVGESFKRFLIDKPGCYSPLRLLNCSACGLTDEDLHAILCCSRNLEELYVPWNEFVCLPTIIKESSKLRYLCVTKCKKLSEIPELPSSIKNVEAKDCPILSSKASELLWSQALKEVYRLEIIMPKITMIPIWFDHCNEGGVVSFWARQKFPVLAVAFILKEKASMGSANLYINGCNARQFISNNYYCPYVNAEHVLLFDLRSLFKDDEEWRFLDTFLIYEWNYVEVKYECDNLLLNDVVGMSNVSHCGAYVYKGQSNMEDIQFQCPYSTM
ncbi:disease resistance protein RPV1-like isoform X2 [Arachis stenosperma]|uniref:disease resistance protein RPV1-like isoform X2 n=1 Tax=Arachis stenosperma TaxID=217475 RepID=UPI0025AC76AD|nr:disease resistance protein RPV1-like isoform X2 [Arachis stenosperma]